MGVGALFGIGAGLVSAPAAESMLGAVPKARAGVGSAANDTTIELGGALGGAAGQGLATAARAAFIHGLTVAELIGLAVALAASPAMPAGLSAINGAIT